MSILQARAAHGFLIGGLAALLLVMGGIAHELPLIKHLADDRAMAISAPPPPLAIHWQRRRRQSLALPSVWNAVV